MDNEKNDAFYIEKILGDLSFVINHTKNLSKAKIEQDELLIDSIMFRIIQIAENSDKLTKEFKDKYSYVPWRSIKGMRNLIVHDYGEVDLSIVLNTVFNSIPEYHSLLSNILMPEDK